MQEKLGEDGPAGDMGDPSLPENQEQMDEEEPVEDLEEEDNPSEEAEDEDRDEEGLVPGRGCLRGCLIPVVVIFVIIMALAMIAYSKRDTIRASLLNHIVANTQNHMLSQLTDDTDKKSAEAVFERLKAAMKESQIDEEILTAAIKEYQDSIPEKLPPEERMQVINRLKEGLNAAIIVSER